MAIPAPIRERFGNLLPAEAKVLTRMAEDEGVVIGETLPAEGNESKKIRADFVVFLARGGCDGAAPPPCGLDIQGAWIAGVLDLRGPAIDLDLGLVDCRFDAAPNLRSARLANLYMNRSRLPGLRGDGLEARGDVFLRGAVMQGEARFLGARLSGDLACDGARFEPAEGVALSADGLETRGGVFLSEAVVQGEARFLGARLSGDLSCTGARFEPAEGVALNADGLETRGGVFLSEAVVQGEARFLGARLGGNLECDGARFERAGGMALNLDGARVAGAFYLRGGASIRGRLDMTDAAFGHINDDRACWPGPGDLVLDRCRYEAFTGGPVDARSRLDWLALQDESRFGKDFWPQPYEQLAKVFREMGHAADARAVLVEKERRQRAAQRAALRARLRGQALRRRMEIARLSKLSELGREASRVHESYAPGDPNRRRFEEEVLRARVLRKAQRSRRQDADPAFEPDLTAGIAAARGTLRPADLDPALAAGSSRFWLQLELGWRCVWDALAGAAIGYGRRPQQAALWLVGFWLLGAVIFAAAEGRGAIKPNTGYTLRGEEWTACAAADPGATLPDRLAKAAKDREAGAHPSQLACFLAQPEGAKYPRFNALVYSLDTLLPIVSLEMQSIWIPDETRGADLPPWDRIGWWARLYLWLHIGLGWGLSLLAVAGFSGLVKSD